MDKKCIRNRGNNKEDVLYKIDTDGCDGTRRPFDCSQGDFLTLLTSILSSFSLLPLFRDIFL